MKKKVLLSVFLLFPSILLHVNAQYCIPVHRGQLLEPIIDGVSLGNISNLNNGFPIIVTGYSDYTSMSTDLTAGSGYTLTIVSGAAWQYNYAAWIDYNHNHEFEADEQVGITITGNSYPTIVLNFTVPITAHDGITRLRVRAVTEPFGVWLKSNDACAPWEDGEAEDYSVNISGGIVHDISLQKIINPVSGVSMGNDPLTVKIQNHGNTGASNFIVNYSIAGGTPVTETFTGTILPDSTVSFTFSALYDFSDLSCYEVRTWVSWTNDESPGDDSLLSSICHTPPVTGTDVWYLQSNSNGGLEPLGGPPFHSTTNRTCMDDVFGSGTWKEGAFETTNTDSVFSTSTCLVFIDGSYDGEVAFPPFMDENRVKIENWVASGGHLLLMDANDGSLVGAPLIFNLGFGDTKIIASYETGYGIPFDSDHPIFNGPYSPASHEWSAFYYAIAAIYGNDLTTLIADNDDEHFLWQTVNTPLLAEKQWGNGVVIFGSISPSQLVTPSSSAMNNRRNTLVYLHQCVATGFGSNSPEAEKTFSVFPNPASQGLFIYLPSYKNQVRYFISDVSGKKLLNQEIISPGITEAEVDVSHLHSGLYFLEVNANDKRLVKKIVIAR